MSVLIKGMAMPKNCAFCPVEHYDCPLLGEDEKGWGIDVTAYFDGNERHPDCPLVEVKSNSRLVDMGDVNNAVLLADFVADRDYENGEKLIFEKSLNERLKEIPIIVESEE